MISFLVIDKFPSPQLQYVIGRYRFICFCFYRMPPATADLGTDHKNYNYSAYIADRD